MRAVNPRLAHFDSMHADLSRLMGFSINILNWSFNPTFKHVGHLLSIFNVAQTYASQPKRDHMFAISFTFTPPTMIPRQD